MTYKKASELEAGDVILLNGETRVLALVDPHSQVRLSYLGGYCLVDAAELIEVVVPVVTIEVVVPLESLLVYAPFDRRDSSYQMYDAFRDACLAAKKARTLRDGVRVRCTNRTSDRYNMTGVVHGEQPATLDGRWAINVGFDRFRPQLTFWSPEDFEVIG